jgi:hypothetical protein
MTVEATDLVLLIDTGSAWAKAALVARHGRRWRIAGGAAQPSAWGETALLDALASGIAPQADARLSHRLAERLASAPRIESHTPQRPGRLALVAVSQVLSAPVLRRAAESAGWVVAEQVTVDDGRPLGDRLAALAGAEVDAWLLGGGFEGTTSPQALEIAALAAAGRGSSEQPVIWAGAGDLADEVGQLFGGAVSVVPNPAPADGVERPAPLRARLEGLLDRVVEPGGAQHLAPVGYRRAITELARSADLRILGVDIGAGYATWIVADAEGEIDARVFAEGGLAAEALKDAGAAARVARDLVENVDELAVADALQNIRARPATLPETDDELAVMQAAARHQLSRIVADEPATRGVDLIIGSGRTIAAAPRAADAARILLDGLRPLGVTQLAIDPSGGLGPLGSLDDAEIGEGIALLRDDLVVPLGTSVVCHGGRTGQLAMRVTVSVEGEDEVAPVDVRTGELRIVPLPRGRVGEVAVELIGGASLGVQRRSRHARARVTGGAVGLILDARDVPLRLPRRPDDRRAVLGGWRDTWARETRAGAPAATVSPPGAGG